MAVDRLETYSFALQSAVALFTLHLKFTADFAHPGITVRSE
jgi:hypothetical protein